MYNDNNSFGRIIGAVCTALYALLVGALILWGSFSLKHEEVIQGMIVDFGVSEEEGYGKMEPITADNISLPEPTATPKDRHSQTQEFEEAPEEMESNLETQPEVEVEKQELVEKEPTQTIDKAQINQLALFPGSSVASEDVSEGVVEETVGNQGHTSGAVSSEHIGVGNIDGFVPDWNLKGRQLINKLVIPPYKGREEGVVVIEIAVNSEGYVTSAEFKAKGSTVGPSSPLVTEAKKSARTARFNKAEQDFQFGTITFRYVLNAK